MNKFLDWWGELTHKLETTLIDNIASTTPWLAPFIPAYLLYHNMSEIMDFPVIISLTGAAVVEFLGLATVTTSVQFWDWNDKHKHLKTAWQSAPLIIALAMAAFYLAVVLIVNVMLDTSPPLQRMAKFLLSTLGVVGAVTLAIRSQHRRRIDEREEQKRARREGKVTRSGNLHTRCGDLDTRSGKIEKSPHRVSRHDWRALTDEGIQEISFLTAKQIVEKYPGMSIRTARDWRRRARNIYMPF